MSFRPVFVALVIGFGLVVGGFLINRQRPAVETLQPGAAFVKASGKCAECHAQQQYSVVHEYEMSAPKRASPAWSATSRPAGRRSRNTTASSSARS